MIVVFGSTEPTVVNRSSIRAAADVVVGADIDPIDIADVDDGIATQIERGVQLPPEGEIAGGVEGEVLRRDDQVFTKVISARHVDKIRGAVDGLADSIKAVVRFGAALRCDQRPGAAARPGRDDASALRCEKTVRSDGPGRIHSPDVVDVTAVQIEISREGAGTIFEEVLGMVVAAKAGRSEGAMIERTAAASIGVAVPGTGEIVNFRRGQGLVGQRLLVNCPDDIAAYPVNAG